MVLLRPATLWSPHGRFSYHGILLMPPGPFQLGPVPLCLFPVATPLGATDLITGWVTLGGTGQPGVVVMTGGDEEDLDGHERNLRG